MTEDLPEMTQESIMHIDSTPNNDYPLRILRAYRANCDVKWSDNTSSAENEKQLNPMLKLMNNHCDERAIILDNAISVLENNKIMQSAIQQKQKFDESWSNNSADPVGDLKRVFTRSSRSHIVKFEGDKPQIDDYLVACDNGHVKIALHSATACAYRKKDTQKLKDDEIEVVFL